MLRAAKNEEAARGVQRALRIMAHYEGVGGDRRNSGEALPQLRTTREGEP